MPDELMSAVTSQCQPTDILKHINGFYVDRRAE